MEQLEKNKDRYIENYSTEKNEAIINVRPGWLSWLSVWLLISTQGMISGFWDRALPLCWTWSLLKILSLSASPPQLVLSLS